MSLTKSLTKVGTGQIWFQSTHKNAHVSFCLPLSCQHTLALSQLHLHLASWTPHHLVPITKVQSSQERKSFCFTVRTKKVKVSLSDDICHWTHTGARQRHHVTHRGRWAQGILSILSSLSLLDSFLGNLSFFSSSVLEPDLHLKVNNMSDTLVTTLTFLHIFPFLLCKQYNYHWYKLYVFIDPKSNDT